MKIRVVRLLAVLLVLLAPSVNAADIDISGYASFKAITNINNKGVSYYNGLAKAQETNYDSRESNIGLQFSTDISKKMDMTVVMSARGGPSQKYNFETEWAYASYKLNDDVSLRIGKIKGPFYMVSDYKDVGYAYPWASVPEEVYSTNPIRSVNGLDLFYQRTVNDVTYLGELYYGSGTNTSYVLPTSLTALNAQFPGQNYTATSKVEFKTHKMLGFNASASWEGISLRAGYFKTLVDAFGGTNYTGEFGGIGMTLDKNNFVIYAEAIVRDTGPELALAFPDVNASYITAGYRMGDFLPYVTAATIGKGKTPSKYAPKQTSTAIGLRMEIDDAASLKIEAANKKPGTYGGDSGGLFDSAITQNVTIVTVALDVLF